MTSTGSESTSRFVARPLEMTFDVSRLISLHYFEFARDFIFRGERHDFWEFLYIDKGEIEVMAETTGYNLKQGDMIFHQPNEFHSVWANRKIASNAVVVSFVCRSPAMSFFEGKIFCLDNQERNLVAELIRYGFAAFEPPFDDPAVHDLVPKENAPPGVEQLIKIHLELLLLMLLSRDDAMPGNHRLSSTAKERSEDEIVRRAIALMEANVRGHLSLEEIENTLNIGQTHLHALFKAKVGMSVMRCFKSMKIETAKMMIREETSNFTEIADRLSYSSIHAFSRHFKTVTDMTPSEYARSVKARSSY
ncbi:AraC family transcriptional regulator [Cohnella nanjingensis]|uniref:Helix-turn-helix transcriptional regulator n=1 Tax=Cohnella nanjingensis TaxID=1387779 RepID=A0A7X0RNE2_9BACL|nr:AraC family transcriptional regulator [Cohnella nanjingensis]MBB6670483.1 helix-turn-helix transcriptional regulator [Cohnella nanjingensis]